MHNNQNLSIQTIIFFLSRLFERMAYYGVRGILILYMTRELAMQSSEAFPIFSWIVTGLVVSRIIGALFGDLLIGNKTSMIIGSILQIIGVLILIMPTEIALYAGLFFIVLGIGFYSPNLTSQFGKLYLSKPKLLDSAFAGLYLAINIGAFSGVLLMGWIAEEFGFNYGFSLASALMILSLLFTILTKNTKIEGFSFSAIKVEARVIKIIVVVALVAVFWSIYQISGSRMFDIQYDLKSLYSGSFSDYIWNSLSSVSIFPIAILMIVLWYFIYNSQFMKLAIGFIFASLSFLTLFFIPETLEKNHLIMYLLALGFLSIAEIHIAPIVHSVLTKYSNPKYLAILISLSFAPTRILAAIVGLFDSQLYSNPSLTLILCISISIVIGLGLLAFIILNRKLKLISNK